jgi:hypothetical protein
MLRVESITSGFLTQTELPQLYHECGRVLHRGTLKTVLSGKPKRAPNFDQINSWLAKIASLLNHRQISLVDTKHEYWVVMQSDKDGQVWGQVTSPS